MAEIDAVPHQGAELANLPNGPEYQVKNARLQEIVQQMQQGEIAQTDTLTDRQVVELVENAIRTRPQDFPRLSKYYLDG